MATYPVDVDVESPPRFERIQLLVRVVIAIVAGWFGITAGWLGCVLYGVLPLVAAISVSSRGDFTTRVAPRLSRVLGWFVQFSAYMMLLVDRFPTGDDVSTRVTIQVTDRPTTGSALLRLLTSLPSALVLAVLWFVSGILWIVGAVFVLINTTIPASILGFQRGVLRWIANLLAYHASLVVEYPPFSLDTGIHQHPEIAVSAAR